jgi:hypothetical protein
VLDKRLSHWCVRNFRDAIEKICATATCVLGDELEGTDSERRPIARALSNSWVRVNATKRPYEGAALIRELNKGLNVGADRIVRELYLVDVQATSHGTDRS